MIDLDKELDELGIPAPGAVAAPEPVLRVVSPDTAPSPLAAAWARWRPELAKAMDGSFHTIEAVERRVFKGEVQFWPGRAACIVTEIVDYPGERALQGLWAAGDVAEIVAMIPGLESFARVTGCTGLLIEGRGGWSRVMKAAGFTPWSVTLRKAL